MKIEELDALTRQLIPAGYQFGGWNPHPTSADMTGWLSRGFEGTVMTLFGFGIAPWSWGQDPGYIQSVIDKGVAMIEAGLGGVVKSGGNIWSSTAAAMTVNGVPYFTAPSAPNPVQQVAKPIPEVRMVEDAGADRKITLAEDEAA